MHLQNLCERFANACNDFRMTINVKKTVVMSLRTSIPPRILVNGSLLNVVDKFSYMGSVVNSSNNPDEPINQRIGKASTNFGRLSSRVWKNHHLTIKLKIGVYTACIMSVLLYNSETWCNYRRQENRRSAFHSTCLRSILGVSWREHVPNSTILHLIGSCILTTIIRQRRLRWLGHVHSMEDGRLPKDILYGEFYNAPRRTGRPKLRYKDVIKREYGEFPHSSTISGNTCCRSQKMACLSKLWMIIVSHKLRRKNGEAPSSSSTTTGWAMMMIRNCALNS